MPCVFSASSAARQQFFDRLVLFGARHPDGDRQPFLVVDLLQSLVQPRIQLAVLLSVGRTLGGDPCVHIGLHGVACHINQHFGLGGRGVAGYGNHKTGFDRWTAHPAHAISCSYSTKFPNHLTRILKSITLMHSQSDNFI
jgi:hypothetical protein